jgi:hypothetical protein
MARQYGCDRFSFNEYDLSRYYLCSHAAGRTAGRRASKQIASTMTMSIDEFNPQVQCIPRYMYITIYITISSAKLLQCIEQLHSYHTSVISQTHAATPFASRLLRRARSRTCELMLLIEV